VNDRRTMAAIVAGVATRHEVTVAQLKGDDRRREYAWARQEAMAAMHAAGFSDTQIGRYLGGRDRSTVSHGRSAHYARDGAPPPKRPQVAAACRTSTLIQPLQGNPWTDDEDRVIAWAFHRGVPRKVIGREIGRSAKSIARRERALGLKEANQRRLSCTWNYGIGVAA
jgi:hypothetical protein